MVKGVSVAVKKGLVVNPRKAAVFVVLFKLKLHSFTRFHGCYLMLNGLCVVCVVKIYIRRYLFCSILSWTRLSSRASGVQPDSNG